MIQLPQNIFPSQEVLSKLDEYQAEIDNLATFEQRRNRAKTKFKSRNKKGNAVFDEVKDKLTEMCSGARRCAYCEDSVVDEIEHIHPKALFPNLCFKWDHFIYACGTCNGSKNNKFALFRKDNGQFYEVNQPTGAKATDPSEGEDVMINPRFENPLDYCMLDLSSTFKYVIIKQPESNDHKKADYTFNEVLRLNEREYLRIARKSAYANFKARLFQYVHRRNSGADQHLLNNLIDGIKKKDISRYGVKCNGTTTLKY